MQKSQREQSSHSREAARKHNKHLNIVVGVSARHNHILKNRYISLGDRAR